MFKCCGDAAKSFHEQLDCKASETEKGVQIEITAKDASKTGSLKAMIKAFHDFCGCSC
jgi:hypothetical protein